MSETIPARTGACHSPGTPARPPDHSWVVVRHQRYVWVAAVARVEHRRRRERRAGLKAQRQLLHGGFLVLRPAKPAAEAAAGDDETTSFGAARDLGLVAGGVFGADRPSSAGYPRA